MGITGWLESILNWIAVLIGPVALTLFGIICWRHLTQFQRVVLTIFLAIDIAIVASVIGKHNIEEFQRWLLSFVMFSFAGCIFILSWHEKHLKSRKIAESAILNDTIASEEAARLPNDQRPSQ